MHKRTHAIASIITKPLKNPPGNLTQGRKSVWCQTGLHGQAVFIAREPGRSRRKLQFKSSLGWHKRWALNHLYASTIQFLLYSTRWFLPLHVLPWFSLCTSSIAQLGIVWRVISRECTVKWREISPRDSSFNSSAHPDISEQTLRDVGGV